MIDVPPVPDPLELAAVERFFWYASIVDVARDGEASLVLGRAAFAPHLREFVEKAIAAPWLDDPRVAGVERTVHKINVLTGAILSRWKRGEPAESGDVANLYREATRLAATFGSKFVAGRKRDTGSLLRDAIRDVLKRYPKATAAEVFKFLAAMKPKDLEFLDGPKTGRFVTTTVKNKGHADTSFGRFSNIVSEERTRLGIRKT